MSDLAPALSASTCTFATFFGNGSIRPLADLGSTALIQEMTNVVWAYTFRDPTFAPSGDTMVCIVDAAAAASFMPRAEVADVFSGYVLYKRGLLKGYVGVWGRRNGKRFRRFLRERGAEIILHRGKPDGLRLSRWVTYNERRRVRALALQDENGS